jgi:hypothetical protein
MKLQKVLAMYSNRSTSNHTHDLVSCNQDFILHNPIDEHLNLQQIVSEPAKNNVRPCNRVIPSHQNSKPCALPFFQGFTIDTHPAAQLSACVHSLFKVRTCGHATITTVTCVCLSKWHILTSLQSFILIWLLCLLQPLL